MKHFIPLMIIILLLIACNDTTNDKPEIDTHSSSDVSQSKRAKQIDNAKNNRALLPGKWQVTDARKEDEAMTKMDLKEINFDVVNFSLLDSFHAYYQKKKLDSGTYEWMAEDRELVMTSVDGTVQRMLIKKINNQYLKLRFNGIYFTLKKMP